MGCRTLYDPENGACFYCSTTGVAFGPVMSNHEEADLFLEKFFPGNDDPRHYDQRELMDKYADFTTNYVCECGEMRNEDNAERMAGGLHPKGCMCGNNGGGDCEWCMAKAHYLDSTQREEFRERFVCSYCINKMQDKYMERHG
jgi:hypothetical protein